MGVKEDNISMIKSMDFAVRIVNLYKYLYFDKNERVLSKQLLRSGTSVGANIREANEAVSKKDFLNKMYISLKEIKESEYWIELLKRTNFISEKEYLSILNDCKEFCKILTAITKTTAEKIKLKKNK
ncbi:MAG: four helix bundle protein [Muribaculaceae bacterium]|nr:four helix bundle protein [Muribaculaceae bacterium]